MRRHINASFMNEYMELHLPSNFQTALVEQADETSLVLADTSNCIWGSNRAKLYTSAMCKHQSLMKKANEQTENHKITEEVESWCNEWIINLMHIGIRKYEYRTPCDKETVTIAEDGVISLSSTHSFNMTYLDDAPWRLASCHGLHSEAFTKGRV